MKKLLPIILIFTVVLFLYYQTFFVYFSQDDFFMFKVSQTNNTLDGFLDLLAIHPFAERGIAFYRPIFREILHNVYYALFGLNHLPFRIIMLIIHFINITLVYILVDKFFNRKFAFLVAFFFGITAANVSLLYYLAGGIEAGGATIFALLTLILYKEYLNSSNLKYLISSFFTFLVAILSHEIVAMIPAILMMIITSPIKKGGKIIQLLPYFLSLVILSYIDLVMIGLSSGESQYKFVFNIKPFLNSISWYSLWALGLPETLIDFVQPGLKINPTLMRYWGNYYSIIFPAAAVALISLGSFLIFLLLKKRGLFSDKRFWFFLFWFPVGILPVIFLPSHKSTHYLVFVLPAFWTIIGFIILNFFNLLRQNHIKLAICLISITLVSLTVLSVLSIRLEDNTYWATS